MNSTKSSSHPEKREPRSLKRSRAQQLGQPLFPEGGGIAGAGSFHVLSNTLLTPGEAHVLDRTRIRTLANGKTCEAVPLAALINEKTGEDGGRGGWLFYGWTNE